MKLNIENLPPTLAQIESTRAKLDMAFKRLWVLHVALKAIISAGMLGASFYLIVGQAPDAPFGLQFSLGVGFIFMVAYFFEEFVVAAISAAFWVVVTILYQTAHQTETIVYLPLVFGVLLIVIESMTAPRLADTGRRLNSLNTISPAHCPEVLEWCKQDTTALAYQRSVADSGRELTDGEYFALKDWIDGAEQRIAARERATLEAEAFEALRKPIVGGESTAIAGH